MQERKDELIDAVIAYLLERGLSDLSLRPLAAQIGTSARLLIYHFKSKEGLLTDVLDVMQARLKASLMTLMEKASTGKSAQPPLMLFWKWAIAEKNYPYLKLVYELQILAIQNPDSYKQYLESNTASWLDFALSATSPANQTPAFARLCCAVFDGLFIDFMSTGDSRRPTQALNEFIRIVGDARLAKPKK
jgi:AcrR family transcriptional regulator